MTFLENLCSRKFFQKVIFIENRAIVSEIPEFKGCETDWVLLSARDRKKDSILLESGAVREVLLAT